MNNKIKNLSYRLTEIEHQIAVLNSSRLPYWLYYNKVHELKVERMKIEKELENLI
jgi:hypothetical protein